MIKVYVPEATNTDATASRLIRGVNCLPVVVDKMIKLRSQAATETILLKTKKHVDFIHFDRNISTIVDAEVTVILHLLASRQKDCRRIQQGLPNEIFILDALQFEHGQAWVSENIIVYRNRSHASTTADHFQRDKQVASMLRNP